MFESEKSHAQQPTKVIIRKSTGEVSLVEQDTIEYVSLAYHITSDAKKRIHMCYCIQ